LFISLLLVCKCRFTRNLSTTYQNLRRKYGMQYQSRWNIFNWFRNALLFRSIYQRRLVKISANIAFVFQKEIYLKYLIPYYYIVYTFNINIIVSTVTRTEQLCSYCIPENIHSRFIFAIEALECHLPLQKIETRDKHVCFSHQSRPHEDYRYYIIMWLIQTTNPYHVLHLQKTKGLPQV
jgi:hypothetical protein